MLKAAKEHQQACRAEYKNTYDDNDYVVVMEDGKPFRPNYLSELFSKFLADNDLPKIVLHELRHTFTSLSNQAGIPAYNIGKALGHSTLATTQKIYTHLLDRAHTQAVEGVAAIADEARRKAGKEYLLQLAKALIDEIRVWDPMKFGAAMGTGRKFSQSEGGSSRIRMRQHSAICFTRRFAPPSAPARSGARPRSAKR